MELLLESLVDYGLFLAKSLTILAGLAVFILLLVRTRHGADHGEELEIVDLNERYRSLTQALKECSMPKKAFK